jgi:hypothetical protein
MRRSAMAVTADVGTAGDEISLLLLAAVQHPEGEVRRRIRKSLEAWVEEARPRYTSHQIAALLQSQEGTAIEPFVLNRRDRYLAVLLTRLAFSERYHRTRFRVVSRETMGTEGGLMLTNHLRAFYIERYVKGYRRRTPDHFGFVAPAEMPTGERVASWTRTEAEAGIDQRGLYIRVGPFDWTKEMGVEPHRLLWLLMQHSFLKGNAILPLNRGFNLVVDRNQLWVRTLGSESMLQLSAHMSQGSLLALAVSSTDVRARVFIRLQPLDRERIDLSCIASGTGSLPQWVSVEAERSPAISRDLRVSVARWFRPHESWIDPELLQELL